MYSTVRPLRRSTCRTLKGDIKRLNAFLTYRNRRHLPFVAFQAGLFTLLVGIEHAALYRDITAVAEDASRLAAWSLQTLQHAVGTIGLLVLIIVMAAAFALLVSPLFNPYFDLRQEFGRTLVKRNIIVAAAMVVLPLFNDACRHFTASHLPSVSNPTIALTTVSLTLALPGSALMMVYTAWTLPGRLRPRSITKMMEAIAS